MMLIRPIALRWLLTVVFAAQGFGEEPMAKQAPPQRSNHLASETSPYLLQHAHNPVDWHPWGEAALAKAKQEAKPIFLSIGYSSCHWCHVMERESFTDAEIAALLNKHFICIKVDREERPDVDSIYMTALQVYNQLSGGQKGGGWPLSMFLTPEGEPFFGGTYFPARTGDLEGLVGFLPVVEKVNAVWTKSPDKVREDAQTLTRFTKRELEGRRLLALSKIDAKLLDGVQAALEEQFDPQWGGFGFNPENDRQPKFPEPSNLVFLLDRADREKDARAREILVATLEKMSLGGIRDHIGEGFHRYSVDRYWRIPHFEKMLYDNGQLLSVYAQAYELTGREDFRRVAIGIADSVLRDMTDEQGGFYAALDADSEGEEGKSYRWTVAEVKTLLGDKEYDLYASAYGLSGEPNFDEKFYVPQLAKPLSEIAAGREMSEQELVAQLSPINAKLLAARDKRPQPRIDTKILTADNGLMIAGLADAGRLLNEPRYIAAAARAADFVLKNLRTTDGRLLRTYGGGKAKLNAYVTDYAYLAEGFVALHEATDDDRWLTRATEITEKQIELFHDEQVGDFFFTSDDHEALLARAKDPVDNALPAANSVTAATLLYLAVELNEPKYLDLAEKAMQATAGLLEASPHAAPRMAVAMAALKEAKGKVTRGSTDP